MSPICHTKLARISYKGQLLPRLCLGTAQLGLPYGIANRIGQSPFDEASRMVEFALKSGINLFDTAQAYGNSEEVLGKIFQFLTPRENIKVITKIHPDASQWDSLKIVQSIRASIKRLSVSKLFCVMLHREEWLRNWPSYADACNAMIGEGLTETLGASIYTMKGFEAALSNDKISVIQLPFNLFDQRALADNCFERAQQAGKLIFIRSIYLQGLLTMPVSDLPTRMNFAKPFLELRDKTLHNIGRDAKETAFRFAYDTAPNAILTVGAETLDQLKENWEYAMRAHILNHESNQELLKLAHNNNELLINPAKWESLA